MLLYLNEIIKLNVFLRSNTKITQNIFKQCYRGSARSYTSRLPVGRQSPRDPDELANTPIGREPLIQRISARRLDPVVTYAARLKNMMTYNHNIPRI